jgi:hypothetical protein
VVADHDRLDERIHLDPRKAIASDISNPGQFAFECLGAGVGIIEATPIAKWSGMTRV